jgi:hypothetical protein
VIEHAGIGIGCQPLVAGDFAGIDAHRVERALRDGAERQVRDMVRVAMVPVIGVLATVEIKVGAGAGEAVEPVGRGDKFGTVYAGCARETRKRAALFQLPDRMYPPCGIGKGRTHPMLQRLSDRASQIIQQASVPVRSKALSILGTMS